jgi:anti-sigma factor RsiW
MSVLGRVEHLRYRGYLDAHVDGELDDSRLAHAVVDHVTRCPMCDRAARTTMVVKHRLSLRRLLPSSGDGGGPGSRSSSAGVIRR